MGQARLWQATGTASLISLSLSLTLTDCHENRSKFRGERTDVQMIRRKESIASQRGRGILERQSRGREGERLVTFCCWCC